MKTLKIVVAIAIILLVVSAGVVSSRETEPDFLLDWGITGYRAYMFPEVASDWNPAVMTAVDRIYVRPSFYWNHRTSTQLTTVTSENTDPGLAEGGTWKSDYLYNYLIVNARFLLPTSPGPVYGGSLGFQRSNADESDRFVGYNAPDQDVSTEEVLWRDSSFDGSIGVAVPFDGLGVGAGLSGGYRFRPGADVTALRETSNGETTIPGMQGDWLDSESTTYTIGGNLGIAGSAGTIDYGVGLTGVYRDTEYTSYRLDDGAAVTIQEYYRDQDFFDYLSRSTSVGVVVYPHLTLRSATPWSLIGSGRLNVHEISEYEYYQRFISDSQARYGTIRDQSLGTFAVFVTGVYAPSSALEIRTGVGYDRYLDTRTSFDFDNEGESWYHDGNPDGLPEIDLGTDPSAIQIRTAIDPWSYYQQERRTIVANASAKWAPTVDLTLFTGAEFTIRSGKTVYRVFNTADNTVAETTVDRLYVWQPDGSVVNLGSRVMLGGAVRVSDALTVSLSTNWMSGGVRLNRRTGSQLTDENNIAETEERDFSINFAMVFGL